MIGPYKVSHYTVGEILYFIDIMTLVCILRDLQHYNH